MLIKQLSVFIENREGRLEEVTKILSESEINIVSLSLAESVEYGVLRMIVSDPVKGKKVLNDAGFSVSVTDVIVAALVNKIPSKVGILYKLLSTAVVGGHNVEYIYTMPMGTDAAIVMKVSNPEAVAENIQKVGFRVLACEEAYSVNV